MTKTHQKLLRIAMIALCVCMSMGVVSFAHAQTITGSVSGTVTDPSGAAVKGATVSVTNVDTGISVSDTTNASGIYNVRFLQIGKYTVSTTVSGFQPQSFGPFSLEIGQVAKVDVKLTVGSAAVSVDVSSTLTPLLDTEDSKIATTMTANTIQNIPLSGRNWSSLTLFVPGAISTNPTQFGGSGNQNAIERNQNGGGVSQAQVNGNRAEGNNYRLDGIEINETLNNLVGYNPNPDAIGELQVISANAPAQYGNVNGGDILAVTKSGTNSFHGSAAIFLQNDELDSNTWANKHVAPGSTFTARNPYTQTQYSGTVGGPIIKDKLFFFADYFGTRYHQGGQTTSSVLSAKMRTGDFSELLDPTIMGTNPTIQLYDPSNGYAPFANNQIPITNPVVSYLIAHPEYYPLPNVAPTPGSPVSNNYRGNTHKSIHNDQGDVKVDYTPTSKDRISGRYSQGEAGDSNTNPLALTFPGASNYPDKGVALNYSRVISSNIVNDLRAGFTRVRWNQGDPLDTTGAFGLNGNKLLGIAAAQAFAGFAAQNVSSLTTVGNSAGGTNFIDNTFIYGDDLSWQLNKHLLSIGTEFVRYQQNNFYPGNDGANGGFTFNGVFTSNPNTSAPGFAAADWALDRSSFSGIGAVTGRTGQRQWRSAYFVQDDWKALPNLTLNLGLRYEYFQPIYEVNNKTMNYDPTRGEFEYAGSIPTGAYPGAVVCKNRSCLNPQYNNFMPRIGFAYQATQRLVVRGGFGITKAMEGTGANLRLTYNAPFANSLEADGTNPTAGSGGLFLTETAGFTAPNGGADVGGFPRIEDPNIKPQQTNEYSLTTEYQLNNFSSFKVSYVGESSQHLIQALRPNQLTRPCIINGVVTDPNANPTGCAAEDPAPFLSLVGENGFVFATVAQGAANYNGLQAQYRQRTHQGLEFTVNYTYAHAFSNSAGFFGVSGTNTQGPYAQNQYDNHAEWGPTASDVRHSLNGTAVYELPFGKGKMFAANANHVVDEAVGGWKLSMTAIAYSGLPVTVSANNVAEVNNHCCSSRPNQISNVKVTSRTVDNWFGGLTGTDGVRGSAKYAAPVVGTFGNAHNGTERAPGFQQYDMSLFKSFTVYRENTLGFRADAYNVFNITSLGNPSNNFSGGNFGQITDVKSAPRQLTLSLKYQF
jgi:outer membrane receptor protein involved in Fe transport